MKRSRYQPAYDVNHGKAVLTQLLLDRTEKGRDGEELDVMNSTPSV